MKRIDQFLQEMDSPENQERMKQWAEEYRAKEQAKQEKIKNMMISSNYINWLCEFTKDKDRFTDEDWLYFPEKISEFDNRQVGDLSLFYEGIEQYASLNHIHPTKWEYASFYRIKYNDLGFEIGILVGQGALCFVNKINLEKDMKYIDFNDIMFGKKQNGVDEINAILTSLSKSIINAYENGVPLESIINTLNITVNDIQEKQEGKSRTLIKK